ncbi:MAG: hypothetical protein K2Q33_00450, partial [Gammaproteobacteria bacterium]|nr:hypothetical protein [Gammaproteobacteria bacterium]
MKIEQYRTLYKILRQEHLINMNTIKKAFRLYKTSGLAGVRAKIAQILGTSRGYEDCDKTVLHGLLNMKPLPESANDILLLTKVTVDIIIPVYKGLSQTKRCILSVLATTDVLKVKHRIIILNDASPEKEITQFLRALPQADNLILIENEV